MKVRMELVVAAVVINFHIRSAHADPLAANSPFLPPLSGGPQASSASVAPPLELRGLMSGPAGNRYWIYNPSNKQGVWVGPNETGNAFVILADDSLGGVEIRMDDGRRFRLKLHEAKVGAEAVASASASGPEPTGDATPGALPQTEAEKKWDEVRAKATRIRVANALALQAALKAAH